MAGILAIVVVALVVAALAGLLIERLCEARDSRRFPPPGRMVGVAGGSLHVHGEGDGAGPTIVIEQGAGSPSIFWRPIQRALARSARVCTYDRAGYLWSPSQGRGRGITARVDDLRQLLVGSGWPGPFVMVGHSYGGLLLAQLARRYPELIAGLVFVDTPEEGVIYGGKYLAQSRSMMRIVSAMSFAARFGVLRLVNPLLAGLPHGFRADDRAPLEALAARPGFFAAMVDDFRSLEHASPAEKTAAPPGSLGAIPICVVSHGIAFPAPYDALNEGWDAGQARLAALSSNGEVIIATKSSHMIQFDEPQLVIDAIARVHAAARAGGSVVNG